MRPGYFYPTERSNKGLKMYVYNACGAGFEVVPIDQPFTLWYQEQHVVFQGGILGERSWLCRVSRVT